MFAFITAHTCAHGGATREDFGRICVEQRRNALASPARRCSSKPLTLDEYLAARPIADADPSVRLRDALRRRRRLPGDERERARDLGLPHAQVRGAIERHNAYADDPVMVRGGWRWTATSCTRWPAAKPGDIDFVQTYDDYPVIVMMQFEDLGFCDKGEGPAFVRAHRFDLGRQLPQQHQRWTAVDRPGRRGGRLSGHDRGDPPAHRPGRRAVRCRAPSSGWSAATAWSPTTAACAPAP